MMKKSAFLILGLALIFLGHWNSMAAESSAFRVITHPDTPVTSLSKTQVSKILLKKTSKWDNGQQVRPVDKGEKDSVREVFTKEIHGRSVSSIQRFWQRQIFSGTDVPPPELASDREVLEFVRNNAGAIGYVSKDAPVQGAGVKVVTISE